MNKSDPQIKFKESYNKLNEAQRLAVDTLEGPVLVVAGPGTGKTQILATRISNLLFQGITEAENVLCLTYTEAGANAMKKRLEELIGISSKNLSIHTFHSFCNRVIVENPDIFRNSQFNLAEKLDQFEILESLLFKLDPSDIHYRPDQEYKGVLPRMLSLFDNIKKENWDSEQLTLDIQNYIIELKDDPKFIYKRSTKLNKPGDFKQKDYLEEVNKYKKTLSAVALYKKYNTLLFNKSFFDYNDLINTVIQNFKSNNQLLLNYQEKFQYILVDEFQDTNGSQLEILDLLISYWDRPNVFVVGDGDQAIYRFQGANIKNLKDFSSKYEPVVINLVENYRSTQTILDTAAHFIAQNSERLNYSAEADQPLHSNWYDNTKRPIIRYYNSTNEELTDVCNQVEELIKEKGVAAKEVAILFRKNKESKDYAKILSFKKIPFSVSQEINIIHYSIIVQIMNIIKYLQYEYDEPYQNDYLLYEILHSNFIEISTKDIGRLSYYINQRNKENIDKTDLFSKINLRQACQDRNILESCKVDHPDLFLKIGTSIDILIKEKNQLTLQNLVEKILYEFNILKFITVDSQNLEALEIVYSFFEYIKTLALKDPEIDLKGLCLKIDRLKNYSLQLPYINITSTIDTVKLSTIHSAKGLEYGHVFLINNVNESKRNGAKYKLPPEFSYTETGTDIEDDRRVFYVGMTRAKNSLQISYSLTDSNAKNIESSNIIKELVELQDCTIEKKEVSQSSLIQAIAYKMEFLEKNFELIDDRLIDRFLEHFVLSATSLESYLECPLNFYYEKVLAIPSARNIYMGFGSAIHKTLEDYLKKYPDLSQINNLVLIEIFKKSMVYVRSNFTIQEYNSYLQLGMDSLANFIKEYAAEWKNLSHSSYELSFKNRQLGKIPISGKIDRLDQLTDGFEIIDYKTGNPKNRSGIESLKYPSDKNPLGGKYWRQVIFYSILCDTDSKFKNKINEASLYFVIPDKDNKFTKRKFSIREEDKNLIIEKISEVYANIMNKEFSEYCGKENCKWCKLLNKSKVISEDLEEVESED